MSFNFWRKTIMGSGRSGKFFSRQTLKNPMIQFFQYHLVFLKYNKVVEILSCVLVFHH